VPVPVVGHLEEDNFTVLERVEEFEGDRGGHGTPEGTEHGAGREEVGDCTFEDGRQ
jgi:hypothetical protein